MKDFWEKKHNIIRTSIDGKRLFEIHKIFFMKNKVSKVCSEMELMFVVIDLCHCQDSLYKPDFVKPSSQIWMLYMLECPLHTGASISPTRIHIFKNIKPECAGLMFTILRECSTAGPCQLDRHLQDGLYHRHPVREVGLLRPQREVQASEHKLRRREDKEGGLVCL